MRVAVLLLGVLGGVLGAIAGAMLLLLGQTVFVAGFDNFVVNGLGVLTVVAGMLGAFGAALAVSRSRLSTGLLVFAAVSAACSAVWFSFSGVPVMDRARRTPRSSVSLGDVELAQTAAYLVAGTGPLFLAAAGLHIGQASASRRPGGVGA